MIGKGKKGQNGNNLGMALLIGLAGMFFLVIIYFTMTGPFERIRDTFNDTYTTPAEIRVSKNVDTVWHWSFLIIAVSIILYMVVVALGRQPREYYL